MFSPGEIVLIRQNARDCERRYWGHEVEVVDGPRTMHWWNSPNIDRPPDFTGPAYWCKDGGREGWVLAESLERKRPPREPTVSWDTVPYFNPTQELVT